MSDRGFFQHGPGLANTWTADLFLRGCMERLLPVPVFEAITPGLATLGERATTEMLRYADDAQRHPPRHVPYDAWGRRIDEIRVADGWKQLHRVAAEEGIVATAYEREHGEHSRLHQFARLYLYHPSSAICSCPLAMTDGAARVIELHGTEAMRGHAFRHLTSRDPQQFWTSGQWMTERTGGSDVSRSETVARRHGNTWRLYGTKWFTSATTSEMAFTLARIEENGRQDEALSLFQLELRGEDGRLRDIVVHRLKDKLGTRALPTAELTLEGTPATLVGERGKGVRTIATLLNITRLYNACSAASQMRRAVMLAADYAQRRVAFGKPLAGQPLHVETLAAMETETRVATLLVLDAARLLGREETGSASEDERRMLRMLTPLVKLYTAKQCIAVCSEALECFGGAGYIEDTGLPQLLRDAQVLSIWEGTTNVLALDLLRALSKDNSLHAWQDQARQRVAALARPELAGFAGDWTEEIARMPARFARDPEAGARRHAFALARLHGQLLLAEHAQWELERGETGSLEALQRWRNSGLLPG